jgi:glycosyltransferase involved in cell wall biosynthesis
MEFSVLMSVYIKEKPWNLDQALKSVINQTIAPNEIILVEDGPLTLELKDIIDRYKKNKIDFNIIKLQKNLGLGRALEIGLTKCKYEIVARMDSDDICIRNRFEKELKYFSDDYNYDVVGSNIYEFEDDISNIVSIKKLSENNEEIIKYSKLRNPLNHPTVMFKKSSVIKAGSYKDFPGFEDYYLWGRMIRNDNRFYNIQEPLLYFRRNSSTFCRRGGFTYLKSEYRLFFAFLEMGIVNRQQFIKSIVYRTIIRIIPNNLRSIIYSKFLREDYKKI